MLARARSLALLVVAGGLAGALAGLGARLAMRASALLSPASRQGLATAEGGIVGVFSWEGTVSIVMIGVFVGITGASLYAALRPLLGARGMGWSFALAALALVGWTILEPRNTDFRAFGVEALNDAMFAALFPLYGVALVRLHAWLDAQATRRAWGIVLWAPLLASGAALALVGLVFGTDRRPELGLAALALVVAAHGARWLVRVARPSPEGT